MMHILGQLTWQSIPYHSPIIMAAVVFELLVVLVVLGLITWRRRWTYLWTEWLTSVDHKRIGVMYIVTSQVMLLRGFIDALMMRTQQAVAAGGNHGFLPPHHYDQFFSEHGVIMIFFVVMPFIVGLINIVVPLQIGARDVAFPFLNSVSLWMVVAAALLLNISLGLGSFAKTGWVAYPPLSEVQYSPGVGVDYYIWVLQLSGFSTLFTGINFFVTIIKRRAPGMHFFRMPLFTWTSFCTSALIMMAFPILTVALALLALDRYVGTHFFTNDLGGNAMMYVNLFWAWGHPEVYILILPAFGVFSEVTPTFSGKALFGYRTLVQATIAITGFSFVVWLHHFYTMGSGANVNAFFGMMTMIIAIPTGVKVFSWIFTMYRGRVRFTVPMLWTLGFLITFTIGGMTGVMLALPGNDYVLHNSLFLVAHFHNTLIGGTLFGLFAGFNYWFPKAFGFTLNERLGKLAFWFWLIGFYLAFMPLYILGFMGMTRRMAHYDVLAWQPYLVVALIGALCVLAGIGCMVLQLVVSIRDRAANMDVSGDPWNARTLEWSLPSPPPVYNYGVTPHVHGVDAFWTYKTDGQRDVAFDYPDIVMPRSTPLGFCLGVISGVLGFALIWQIWWEAALALVLGIGVVIYRSYQEDIDYVVPAAEVARSQAAYPGQPKVVT